MNKSLTPLIIIFSLIILATIIVGNFTSPVMQKTENNISKYAVHLIKETDKGKLNSSIKIKLTESMLAPDRKKLFQTAQRLYEKNELDKALSTLQTIVVFFPDDHDALFLLAHVYYLKKRYGNAEIIYQKLLKESPNDSFIYNNLGAALAKQHKFKEAIKVTKLGLKYAPESTEGMLNLSGMFSALGNKEESIKYFSKVYDIIGFDILSIANDPTLDNVREEPEFQRILKLATDAKAQQKKVKSE
jgi:tetratricopeptide (TPR) repeat protein